MRKIATLATLFLMFAAITPAHAAIVQYEAILSGLGENPPNASPATGLAQFDFDTLTNTLTLTTGTFSGLLAPATAGHIHTGPAGVNGPVIIPFTTTPATSGVFTMPATVLTAGQVTALTTAGLYVNIHTSVFPGGEIRGQIMLVPAPAGLAMLGCAGLLGGRRRRR